MRKGPLIIALGTLLGLGGAASAQGRAEDRAAAAKKAAADREKAKDAAKAAKTTGNEEAPGVKVERGAGGKKVYRITTGFVIEGRIQKPNAFYVLERSQINYDWAQLKQDFVPRIVDAVRGSPF
ncbi:MAG: hypothetical protein IT371_29020 [Deltaproteobacteria bacterium]|nr:hypothetical protein [Deltaproteobacteria bacterium]